MHKRIEKQLVGASGVFYVATELSRRGWIANRRRKTSMRQFPNPEGKKCSLNSRTSTLTIMETDGIYSNKPEIMLLENILNR